MNILEYTIGVLIFVTVLTASIGLHEVGHLVPAKKFGVRVTQYMIGFGPTIWSKVKGDTEYGVKGIPLGGYIMMIGMYPPKKGEDGTVRESSTGLFHSMVEEARQLEAARIGPEDSNRVFYKLPVWQKLVVMTGGPLMNLVIGTIMLGLLVVTIGDPNKAEPTRTIGTVYECVVPAGEIRTECGDDDPAAPANQAGLRPGDTIVRADGREISTWESMRELIRVSPDESIDLVVMRDGQEHNLTLTPALTAVPVVGDDGEAVTTADGSLATEEVGFAGFTAKVETSPGSVGDIAPMVWSTVTRTVEAIFYLPNRLIDVAKIAFGPGERDPNGPIGVVGIGRISGEVVSLDTVTMTDKVSMLLGMLGGLNIFLFVFNLLPILPFDGGHAAGATWEGLRRWLAKVRGKADPGPVDVAKALPVAYGVASLLVAMSVLLLYVDIVKPITLQ